MRKKQPLTLPELIMVLFVLAGVILYWINIDPTGYVMYSSLIVMTLVTVARQLKDKSHEFKYSKWLLIGIVFLIVITGIDRMVFKELNPSVFTICFILYIFIQPKPTWITRH